MPTPTRAHPQINGRLAMLGFVAAAGCELFTGQTIGAQAWANFGFVFKLVLLVSAASLATIYRGVRNDEAFGPLTPEAELKNGRMAMVRVGRGAQGVAPCLAGGMALCPPCCALKNGRAAMVHGAPAWPRGPPGARASCCRCAPPLAAAHPPIGRRQGPSA